ncbi:LysR family transcriptional regulator [Neptuniibacter sp. 1_MG-2023]|uniref:LysR family transcriptional regulator n=1 Tax=Neptuniibacter sp. 1_MG-2023 TaxID=3062662 RepID=UPI0026E412C4|nr:LysR family transcriptional regulator [Neptuniibacter sp. 1_MG-2023]MDO6594435.1 LysR family transcriptional regulator [Neptuniibacter sp. 1_MG-2023]
MKAKDMTNIYWFCQSVESGGFAAASINTKVSAPTLSRAVAQLEETLGEKLIHRNAKQFQLTKAGDIYYQKFSSLYKQLDTEWEKLSDKQPKLVGDIHVSCPETFAEIFLQQTAIEFMEQNPGVNIHILFSSDIDHFFDDQIDLAIVTRPAQAPNLVQRRLFNIDLSLAAAPSYLDKKGTPVTPEDLLKHHLLMGNTMQFWEFKQQNKIIRIPVKPKYSINSLRLCIQAACSGIGICMAPKAALQPYLERGELLLLPEIQCESGIVYMVWADQKLVPARLAAFRNMILERLDQPADLLSLFSNNAL